MSDSQRGVSSRRGPLRGPLLGLLLGLCLVAGLGGAALGSRLQNAASGGDAEALALARVGLALSDQAPAGGEDDWAQLRDDLDTVRSRFASPQREIFDLVVAVRGLESAGTPDWGRAEQRCRALGWPRCDRTALEELRKRSRP